MTDFSTLAVHGGYNANRNDNAVSVPIYASAAFDLENAARGRDLAAGEISGFEYSRVANPTVDALERRLAALEGGVGAVAVSSGMAAVSYALMCAGGGRWPHHRADEPVWGVSRCARRLPAAVRHPR